MTKPLTYEEAGVNRAANVAANEQAKHWAEQTRTNKIVTPPGMFSAGYDLSHVVEKHKQPEFFLGMHSLPEGVDRTTESLEQAAESLTNTMTQTLIERGIEPLFLSNYIAFGELDDDLVGAAVKGVHNVAKTLGIDLSGGETAEMPDVIKPNQFEMFVSAFGVKEHEEGFFTAIHGFNEIDSEYFTNSLSEMTRPIVLVTSDGVGTKTMIAVKYGIPESVAYDLVNHMANDARVQGGKPFAIAPMINFNDANQDTALRIRKEGFVPATDDIGMALSGGECLRKKSIFCEGQYDVAGTMLALVEFDDATNRQEIQVGDHIFGHPAVGIHTNGYSLARKAIFGSMGHELTDRVAVLGDRTIGEVLLDQHPSYLAAMAALEELMPVKQHAHITGGGLIENAGRGFPDNLRADLSLASVPRPTIFTYIEAGGPVEQSEMQAQFNEGVGLTSVVDKKHNPRDVMYEMANKGFTVYHLGDVYQRRPANQITIT